MAKKEAKMNEIDKFCMFVNTTNGLCRSPINTKDKYCDEIPIEKCYYKQLQQAIKDRNYYKQIVDGCKSENGNCSFCEIDKQLQEAKKTIESQKGIIKKFVESEQQLKVENKELKKKKEEDTTFYLKKYANKDSECLELQHKVNILKQCLNEIEEICQKEIINLTDSCVNGGRYFEILQFIKQTKEGEEWAK